jgi:hypothetical protein
VLLYPHQGAARLPSFVAICRQRSSCRRRRCPQPGDQRQDFLEHLPRHRDLSAIWKVTYRPWLTTFAPILISFSRKLVSDHGSAVFGIASVRMKLPRL